jgi:hypothetical protein
VEELSRSWVGVFPKLSHLPRRHRPGRGGLDGRRTPQQ